MKFRKKPVVIEAEQYQPFSKIAGVVEVIRTEYKDFNGVDYINPLQTVEKAYIKTLEGKMEVKPGDWVITGVKGERYPCKPDIFEMTYEPVEASK